MIILLFGFAMAESKYPKPPSHRTFTFGAVVIDSDFDSGNCSHVQKISMTSYEVWIGTDNPKNNYRTWFYFSVLGFNQGATVSFKIKNMQNQSKLLSQGLVPVFREEGSTEWRRIKQKINLSSIEYNEGWIQWVFKHTFTSNQKVYLALFYPWSNQDNALFFDSIQQKVRNMTGVYFYRSSIINTLEGRSTEFIAISSNLHKINREQKIDDSTLFQGAKKPHAFSENKKGIVLSARVHPGQLPGSHVLNGIVQQITEDHEKARLLRDNFVFYIFPILNPDGVARGHYRVDTNGINLNRCYLNPTVKFQPTIYAIKSWIMHLHSNNRFFAFLDLHAHASRRGTFIYGNSVNQLQKQVETCIFPKILSMNSADFQYEGSNFTEQNMYCKDKSDHMSKQGSGRVAIYKATKNAFCWTLECNYNISKINNILEPRKKEDDKVQKPKQTELNSKIILNYRNSTQRQATQFFTISTFRKLGRQICESFLDLIEKNPESRIDNPKNYFQSVQNLKMNLAIALLRMAPNRFETHFKKIYNTTLSENTEMAYRSVQALYYLIIKNAKITNINSFIKDGDLTSVVMQSPKKSKSASVSQQPKFSSLLERKTLQKSKIQLQHEWKSQKNIEKCNIDLLNFHIEKRQSLNVEFNLEENEKCVFDSEDNIQNIICEKLKLYQKQKMIQRTTTLKLQTPKMFGIGMLREQATTRQRELSPNKTNKIRFRVQPELPSLRKKNSLMGPGSPTKGNIFGNVFYQEYARDPFLYAEAD